MADIKLSDLLASESEVLKRIAADIAGATSSEARNMAGHYSSTSGHRSSGTHTSHSSGVTSAAKFKDDGSAV